MGTGPGSCLVLGSGLRYAWSESEVGVKVEAVSKSRVRVWTRSKARARFCSGVNPSQVRGRTLQKCWVRFKVDCRAGIQVEPRSGYNLI